MSLLLTMDLTLWRKYSVSFTIKGEVILTPFLSTGSIAVIEGQTKRQGVKTMIFFFIVSLLKFQNLKKKHDS